MSIPERLLSYDVFRSEKLRDFLKHQGSPLIRHLGNANSSKKAVLASSSRSSL